jgi:hypothetical protein
MAFVASTQGKSFVTDLLATLLEAGVLASTDGGIVDIGTEKTDDHCAQTKRGSTFAIR